MYPFLKDGDRLVVKKLSRPSTKLIGKVVVATDPRNNGVTMVKRLVEVDDETFTLIGDNFAESTDSRAIGRFPHVTILGVVFYRYYPLSSAGWIRRRLTND